MSGESPFLPEADPEPEDVPVPWGFRFTLIAAAIYLLYRFGQGIVWVFDQMGTG